MKTRLVILLVIVTGLTTIHAQEPVDIYGYYESQIMGAEVNNVVNTVYSNKLRVDLQSDFSQNISFQSNFNYLTYHGKTRWNILEFLSGNIASQVPEEMRSLYVIPFTDRNFLDNAYVKVAFNRWDLTTGKQQISTGSGYVWNPTDVFNIKDVVDPTYEQPGHNAIRADVPIGLRYTITGIVSPEDTWDESAKLIRFKGRLGHFDYSVLGIKTEWTFHDYTRFLPEQQHFAGVPERRRLIGGSVSGELFGLGLLAECAWNSMEDSGDFSELVVGLNYTFDFQTYVMLEYYRNTLGKSDYQEYTLNDWMRQFTSEQKAISRDQIYALIQHPLGDFIQLGLSGVYSISDRSTTIVPTLFYSYSQNMEITAYLNVNIGKSGTAYAGQQGNGGLIRARIYF